MSEWRTVVAVGIVMVAGCAPTPVDHGAGGSAPPADTREVDVDVTALELPALDVPPENPPGSDSAATVPGPRWVEPMAATWGVSREVAALRLRLQDGDEQLVAALRSQLPEVYVHRSVGPQGESVYGFTAELPDLREAIVEIHADAGIGTEHVAFEVLPFSAAELAARQDRAMQALGRHDGPFGIEAWGVATDSRTGTSHVDLGASTPEFEAAVRDDLDHDIEFRTGAAPGHG